MVLWTLGVEVRPCWVVGEGMLIVSHVGGSLATESVWGFALGSREVSLYLL